MMDIAVYRNIVGRFYDTATSLFMYRGGNIKFRKSRKILVHYQLWKIILFLFSIFIVCNAQSQIHLKLSGDIESNPGPRYVVAKVVQGSFHQGNERFGSTAGIQCACNSLYALCWSKVKKVFAWNISDLDHILTQGDLLYKSLGKNCLLAVDELPRSVNINDNNISLVFTRLETKIATLADGDPFLRSLFRGYSDNLCLLLIAGYTTAILQHNNLFYLFDSHSRDMNGLCIADGKSILMKFESLLEIEQYIQVIYLEYKDKSQSYFQVQFINVDIDANVGHNILSYYQKVNRRLNYQKSAEKINEARRNKYRETCKSKEGEAFKCKKRLLDNSQYLKICGTQEHEDLKARKRKQHKVFLDNIKGSPQHEKRKEKDRIRRNDGYKDRVSAFKMQIQEGPFYVCIVCNRCMYRRSICCFRFENYQNLDENMLFVVKSHDGNIYICLTCHRKIKKNDIPCQAVVNKLGVDKIPVQFQTIRKLERVLVSRRILFKKVSIMPKGESPKLKGSVCNVPISEIDTNCMTLPRPSDSNGLIIVKLKRKVEYRSHVLFEPVRPSFVESFLKFLKQVNHLYSDIEINVNNISESVTCFEEGNDFLEEMMTKNISQPIAIILEQFNSEEKVIKDSNVCPEEKIIFDKMTSSVSQPMQIVLEPSSIKSEATNKFASQLEEQSNPLAAYQSQSTETIVSSEIPSNTDIDEVLTIAPGEGKRPISVLADEYCEEMAHPHLFPYGRYGYKVERDIPLTPSKYFNQRLLNFSQVFAADSDYIFFAHSVMQKIQLNNQINIAMKKVGSKNLTAGMLSKNFKATVKQFIAQNKAYSFMNPIKGTPAYWKKFLHEVFAMVKQLGIPTFFMTLSCADLRWNELILIISKLNSLNIRMEDIKKMTYQERCETLNKNVVLVARHFQYRVEVFFKVIVMNGPLGKTKYYAIRVEFQVRGSPHIHSFIWILNAPKLDNSTKLEYSTWIENIVRADLPDPNTESELYELVKTYQIHRHSKTCRKYRNQNCRFHFGKFFTNQTIIAEPLPKEMPDNLKKEIMEKRKNILTNVKNYIDNELNPVKNNFYDPTRSDFQEVDSIKEILDRLEINETEYYAALSISDDNDFQIHLKRPPNSCFVYNYFTEGLLAWEANLDIQPVFNHYKAVAYMCAYLSKSEDECSQAMSEAMKDAFEKQLDNYEQMKSVAHAYTNKRECSIQECVYHLLSGQWLRKTFPGVVFANSNVPEKRYRICLNEEEIAQLPEESTDVFKKNMIDRYIDRPNSSVDGGKYSVLENFCYAEFLRYYYVKARPNDENDYQPQELKDDIVEKNHTCQNHYPKVIKLLSSNVKLQCRKIPLVLQYHVPHKDLKPEEYAHHMLFMYFPFRNEADLKLGTYANKLSDTSVLEIVNSNRQKVEPYATVVDDAFRKVQEENQSNIDPFGQQENEETYAELDEGMLDSEDEGNVEESETMSQGVDFGNQGLQIVSDNVVNETIRSLNEKQRQVFDIVHKWARDYIKNLNSRVPKYVTPFNIFLTGGAGVGKSHLIKAIHMSLSKLLMHKGGNPEKPKILLLAPTGVAAININGTTIHSGLGLNIGSQMYPLSGKQKAILQNKLSQKCGL